MLDLEREQQELMARLALTDNHFWLTQCTLTKDEQDPENPYKPFPNKMYLRLVLNYLKNEPSPVKFIKKSRTMMGSWAVSGWAAHWGFTHPATCVGIQSRDERRALKCIEYIKELWKNSIPPLKDGWPIEKPIDKFPAHEFRLTNGSKFVALTGDPDNIRSEHPTIVILDEAAFMEAGEESYNTAVATKCLHLIVLSSAQAGWFEDMVETSQSVQMPSYMVDQRAT